MQAEGNWKTRSCGEYLGPKEMIRLYNFTTRNFIFFYYSPNTFRVIKSGKLRGTGHVVRME